MGRSVPQPAVLFFSLSHPPSVHPPWRLIRAPRLNSPSLLLLGLYRRESVSDPLPRGLTQLLAPTRRRPRRPCLCLPGSGFVPKGLTFLWRSWSTNISVFDKLHDAAT